MDKDALLTQFNEKFSTYDKNSLQVAFACALYQNGRFGFTADSGFFARTHMFWSPLMKWEDSTLFPEEMRKFFAGWEIVEISKVDFGFLDVKFSKNGVELLVGLSWMPMTNGITFAVLCNINGRWENLTKENLPQVVEDYAKLL